jgi:general secretion pathway protein A
MYERFFGLDDQPFRLTPDPRYLFLSPKHAEALANLRLGLNESSGFVCITGDVGTGKTTLLRALLADLADNVTAAYILTPSLSVIELLRRINRELGLPSDSESQLDLVDALNAHLLAQRAAGRIVAVVLDEAQALSIDVLEQIRLLLNLETEKEKLLRVILVGQPQLRGLLVNPALKQLNQRITLRCHMGPLSYRETVAYVRHRLGVASRGEAVHVFSVPALRLLHSVSDGVPRVINMIAHRAMLTAFVARRSRVTRRYVAKAYHEIQAVPLPGTLTTARRFAWAGAGGAVGVALVTLGMPHLAAPFLARKTSPASPPPAVALAPAEPAPEPAAAPAPPPVASEPPAAAPVAALPPAEPTESMPQDESTATAAAAELEARLAALSAPATARAAMSTLLNAWQVRPLASQERVSIDEFERIAWQRGLDDLVVNGNRSMLRQLDLPAILELRVASTGESRYAALMGMDDRRVVLTFDHDPMTIDAALLEQFWFGHAHILWRDFEGLGLTFGSGARGPHVARLQDLLRRARAYEGTQTGQFDAPTAAAVIDFQRSRLLVPDARVGRLTRIVLYAAAGGYRRPALALAPGASS